MGVGASLEVEMMESFLCNSTVLDIEECPTAVSIGVGSEPDSSSEHQMRQRVGETMACC